MNVERFARLVLGLSALAFAGIGAAFLVAPEAMAARVGVSLAGATAANDVRAVYGGLQLGIAAFLFHSARRPETLRTGLAVQLFTFAGLAAARLVSLLLDGNPGALGLALHAAELLGFACGAVARARLLR
ncbi:MAG: DUF4345 domain-containing protein [Deltaproteobacteria bacterium]|nr:DUF4345 domain-containing protein [Deltaproteobacteria bacterium]